MVSSFFLSSPWRASRGRAVVDDAHHLEPGDLPGVLGGLSAAHHRKYAGTVMTALVTG